MEPNNRALATVEGNLGGERIAMGIDESSFAHIMSIMTDLYSDQIMAIIREYSTNARDANLEAGKGDVPIRVTLPSRLSPYFTVRDDGVGLSVNDISEIYSQYGASTKRSSNAFNGMLGLGCKSALSYTQQFTVTSVKNSIRTMVSVSRTDDGGGVMEVVDTSSTTESNHTEISVPVGPMDTDKFRTKAQYFFKHWNDGEVRLNGDEPAKIDGEKITDSVMLVRDAGYEASSILVMGGVPYPIVKDSLLAYPIPNNHHLVVRVNMGEINFTPSREALMYTTLTKTTLDKYLGEYKAGIVDKIQKDIDTAENHHAAILFYKKWRKLYSLVRTDFTYKGATLPAENGANMLRDPKVLSTLPSNQYRVGLYTPKNYYSSKVTKHSLTESMFDETVLIITNYPNVEKGSSSQREKIKIYLKDNNIQYSGDQQVLLFTDTDVPKNIWWDAIPRVDWKTEVSKIVLNNSSYSAYNAGVRSEGRYEIWDGHNYPLRHLTEKDTDIVYYTEADYKYLDTNSLTSLLPGATIIRANRNRWDKLTRLHPQAKGLRSALAAKGDEFYKNLPYETLVNLQWQKYQYRLWDEARIDDPEVKKFLNALNDAGSIRAAQKIQAQLKIMAQITGFNYAKEQLTNPWKKYPLASNHEREDSYLYMNAKYAVSKKGN